MSGYLHPDPKKRAEIVFEESIGALMAHSIRAATNVFRLHGVDLDVIVRADTYDTIISKFSGDRKPPSVLLSSFYPGVQGVMNVPDRRPRVVAQIFIHRFANKDLARLCVAHELFHVLCELHQWMALKRPLQWTAIQGDTGLEDLCNQFAWELCKMHDAFNKDEEMRKIHIHFPDGLFATEPNWEEIRKGNWPDGLKIDPENPFRPLPNSG